MKKIIKASIAFTILSVPLVVTADTVPWKADNIVNNFDTSTPNDLEIVIPVIKTIDDNQDEYPEKIKIYYDVYALGTNQKLYSTKPRQYRTPDVASIDYGNSSCGPGDWGLDLTGEWIGSSPTSTRVTYVFELTAEENCENGGFEDDEDIEKVFIYSGNAKDTNKSSWQYQSNDYFGLRGVGGVDTDNDGKSDFLGLATSTYDDARNKRIVRIESIEFSNGNINAKNNYNFVVE